MKYVDQIRFKWYHHIIFWMAYVLFWAARDLVHHPDLIDNIQLNLISGFLHAGLAYFNVYILLPRFLLKKKSLTYLAALFSSLSITAFTTAHVLAYYLSGIHNLPEIAEFFISARGIVVQHFETFFVTLTTLAIVLVKIYFIKDNDTRELTKKNLETELNFLKNQINPHFLFNSLNSIYFLIPKNPKKAAEILLKFSDMLSHQLYEGNKDFISLEDEIKYLENYIQLEKVRQGERVSIDWSVDGVPNGHQVAPMIFLTFLENAFKHGQQADLESYKIEGKLDIQPNEIRFNLKNDASSACNDDSVGVGLENTKRRLELLYPNRYELRIDQSNGTFSVELTVGNEN